MPWRSVCAIAGWLGGSIALFITLPLALALPLVIGFGLVVMTLNKFRFP